MEQPKERILHCATSGKSLYHLDLPMQFRGIRSYLSPWVITESRGFCFLVDPGPAAVAEKLAAEFSRLHLPDPDWILLTHIHLDHAGGAGHLGELFPKARIWVPPGGGTFLARPEILAHASRKTLGSLGEAYGFPRPLEKERMFSEKEILPENLEGILTPGHAPYHAAFLYRGFPGEKILFTGDAAGMYHAALGKNDSGHPYLRPGTPHKFFFSEYMDSLAIMKSLESTILCYGHCGMSREPRVMLELHGKQMYFWRDYITERLREEGFLWRDALSCDSSWNYEIFLDTLREELLREDPLLWGVAALPRDLAERERNFLRNSVKGMAEWIRRNEAEASSEELFC
ncbi:MAG TPA: MBL fold metallo-hydrolase [Synergistaceae bacterium]|nr:MBL fold metallo-hydrolase [Synergistaceae bacterium]